MLLGSEEVSEEFRHKGADVINEKQATKYEASVSKETKTQLLGIKAQVLQSTVLNPAILQVTLVTADVLEETSRG